ncbi:butyrate kinase [bacterium]|nr:butyrate kinase [bacterium]
MKKIVLAINPGSTSTKIACATETDLITELTIEHPAQELRQYNLVTEQIDLREKAVQAALQNIDFKTMKLVAVVGRGGIMKPIQGGTYLINQKMLDDLRTCTYGNHPSNLGAILAHALAEQYHIPSYVVDPVTVDELIPEARISGVPGIERISLFHALNVRATARRAAQDLHRDFSTCNFVLAHLGGGISIAAFRQGKIIDVNKALLGQGPFSPNRAGSTPIGDIVNLCFSGTLSQAQILKLLASESGLYGYLKTADVKQVLQRIDDGDDHARLIYNAMIYQITKEIGAMAVALKAPQIDAIVLTGGMAHSTRVIDDITGPVRFLAPIMIYPGENELEALIQGAFRVLNGLEIPKNYH